MEPTMDSRAVVVLSVLALAACADEEAAAIPWVPSEADIRESRGARDLTHVSTSIDAGLSFMDAGLCARATSDIELGDAELAHAADGQGARHESASSAFHRTFP
jgi:hypothetical protein